ncbi:hypothetical protein [Spirosoma linguale]|uniref:Peptidase C39-like domain-containing protein n=1 Tax=Spirosoma linguale (strain ATCC 33905 / DSM 74 / LMG 10896 / Claus 1) TaxID=504472 RepID=D2QQM9_SPILD|nr:hypothetical protein Slin_4832 [Spirosoma linguale DSM 74]
MKNLFVLLVLIVFASLRSAAQQIYEAAIDPEPIAAAQRKTNWCWAAGCEMLAKSQGVEVPQEWFVERIFGPRLPNFPTGGSFEPIRRALTGTFETKDGETVRLRGAYHYGVPTDPAGMIASIEDERPFIFAWEGHVYVCYALKYILQPALRVIELELIDPLFGFGRPMYKSFNVFRDNPNAIDGTFELIVSK